MNRKHGSKGHDKSHNQISQTVWGSESSYLTFLGNNNLIEFEFIRFYFSNLFRYKGVKRYVPFLPIGEKTEKGKGKTNEITEEIKNEVFNFLLILI